MPQHKSTEKRMRTSAAARLRNRQDRTRYRSVEKRVLQITDQAAAQAELKSAYEVLDHMATKGVLHANTAARHKARLARHVNSLRVQS